MRAKYLFALPLVATTAATEVVRTGMSTQILGVLAMLISITAITFIIVLLACGLRSSDL